MASRPSEPFLSAFPADLERLDERPLAARDTFSPQGNFSAGRGEARGIPVEPPAISQESASQVDALEGEDGGRIGGSGAAIPLPGEDEDDEPSSFRWEDLPFPADLAAAPFAGHLTEDQRRGFLRHVWNLTLPRKSVAECRGYFREAQVIWPDDPRVPYAFALALAENERYDEAVEQLYAIVASDAPELNAALQLLVWVLLAEGNASEAIELMLRLRHGEGREQLAAADHALIAWLGYVSGYLSGPAALPQGQKEALESLLNQLRSSFDGDQVWAFRAGERMISDRFGELVAQRDRFAGGEVEQTSPQRTARVQEREELEDRVEKLDVEAFAIARRLEEFVREATAELEQLRREYQTLASERYAVRRSRLAAEARYGRLRSLPGLPLAELQEVRRESERLATAASQLTTRLRQLTSEIGRVETAIHLAHEMARQQLQTLSDEKEQLRRQLMRLNRLIDGRGSQRSARPSDPDPTADLARWTLYLEIDYDRARAAIRGSYPPLMEDLPEGQAR